jgi:DNA repair photolyase
MYAYQCDPYVGCEYRCAYCYALNWAETEWAREILVHRNYASQLQTELSAIAPQTIYMGMNSDPYQPLEESCGQARQTLELFTETGFSACILTKSDLVVRDIKLLQKMTGSSVGFSFAFQNEEVRIKFEPYAPSNQRRITALKKLKEAGIETYALICPVMPYITNVETLIEVVAPVADTIWIYPLVMKSENGRNWKNVLSLLSENFPDLVKPYQQVAFEKDHPYWLDLSNKLEEALSKRGLNWRNQLKRPAPRTPWQAQNRSAPADTPPK